MASRGKQEVYFESDQSESESSRNEERVYILPQAKFFKYLFIQCFILMIMRVGVTRATQHFTTHPAAVKKHLAESQKYATDEGLWDVFIVVIAAGCSSWLVTSFLMIVSLCLRFANCSKTLNVHDTLHLTRMQTKQPLYFIPHRFYYFMFHISDGHRQEVICSVYFTEVRINKTPIYSFMMKSLTLTRLCFMSNVH